MSSILIIILYHLTDIFVTESFPCQIAEYLLSLRLSGLNRIKMLFSENLPDRFIFTSAFAAGFKRGIRCLGRNPLPEKERPYLPSTLHILPLRTKFSAYRLSSRYPKDLTYSTAPSTADSGYIAFFSFSRRADSVRSMSSRRCIA